MGQESLENEELISESSEVGDPVAATSISEEALSQATPFTEAQRVQRREERRKLIAGSKLAELIPFKQL